MSGGIGYPMDPDFDYFNSPEFQEEIKRLLNNMEEEQEFYKFLEVAGKAGKPVSSFTERMKKLEAIDKLYHDIINCKSIHEQNILRKLLEGLTDTRIVMIDGKPEVLHGGEVILGEGRQFPHIHVPMEIHIPNKKRPYRKRK